jgi:YidC/Oxa1 family membrane protein insertase
MNRRALLAIALVMIVMLVPAILFPPKPVRPPVGGVAPETLRAAPAITAAPPTQQAPAPRVARLPAIDSAEVGETPGAVSVRSPLYEYRFATRGARLTSARMLQYRSFAVGDTGVAQLVPAASEFLAYRLVVGSDTVSLADWSFVPSANDVSVGGGGAGVDWVAQRGGVVVRLRYTFLPDAYVFRVTGAISGLGGAGGLVLVGLGPGIRTVEADSALDFRSRGVVTKATKTESLDFTSLEPGQSRVLTGPFEWVAIKTKYFVAAILAVDGGAVRLGGAVATGAERSGKNAVGVHVVASLPAPDGRFAHSVYVGPQEYRSLARIGHDFEDVNPYGWVFRPIIFPVSIGIVQLLLWMHEHLSLAYGWVLILFGLAVRVVLWPLQQKSMRSQVAMQAMQPELKAVQDRHKNDPQKLQQEMMRLYKHHNVNPLGGCLPMLIPMPVLFALFFVFANTIEFRGAPFLWLPDLSRADPLYIIPIVMGLSMFAVSKIGQIGVPPNPQTQMMVYMMPVVFTVMFLKFSSGLNLYYAVSNIATIPQQWLIARERLQKAGKPPG